MYFFFFRVGLRLQHRRQTHSSATEALKSRSKICALSKPKPAENTGGSLSGRASHANRSVLALRKRVGKGGLVLLHSWMKQPAHTGYPDPFRPAPRELTATRTLWEAREPLEQAAHASAFPRGKRTMCMENEPPVSRGSSTREELDLSHVSVTPASRIVYGR